MIRVAIVEQTRVCDEWKLTCLVSRAAGRLDLGREGRDEGLGTADALEVGQGAASGPDAGLSWDLLQWQSVNRRRV